MKMQLNEEAKHVATEVVTHPKSAWVVTVIANWATFYVEWVSLLVSAMTSIGSFALVILLVRYHLKNSKKLDQDYEIGQENLKKLKRAENDKGEG